MDDYMARQIWKFYVKEGCEEAFLKMNGLDGDWATFFKGSPDYRGTRVSREVDSPRTYLTEDQWTSRAAFDSYVDSNRERFNELSALHEELYEDLKHIGFFEDQELQ